MTKLFSPNQFPQNRFLPPQFCLHFLHCLFHNKISISTKRFIEQLRVVQARAHTEIFLMVWNHQPWSKTQKWLCTIYTASIHQDLHFKNRARQSFLPWIHIDCAKKFWFQTLLTCSISILISSSLLASFDLYPSLNNLLQGLLRNVLVKRWPGNLDVGSTKLSFVLVWTVWWTLTWRS